MKKRFTRILAAVALLAALCVPFGMRGQTYVYTMITNISDVTEGVYVIGALRSTSATNNFYFATTTVSSGDINTTDGNSGYLTVEDNDGVRSFDASDLPTDAKEFTFTGNNTSGFTIANGSDFLYFTASSNRKLAFGADGSEYKWKAVSKSGALITGGVYLSYTGSGNYTISENSTAVGAIRGYANTTAYRAIYLFKKEATGSSTDPTISADNVNIAYNVEEGEIEYSITNPVEGGSITASTTSDWLEVDDNAQTTASGAIDFICDANPNFYARTATVVLTYKNNENVTLTTKNVTVTQALNPNGIGSSQDNPYTVAQACAAIDAAQIIENAYVTGIVSQVDSYSSTYHSITYWISDDGTTTNQLEAYSGISGIEGWTFESKDDIVVGATVVIRGKLKKFNTTYEFDYNNELVSYNPPTTPTISIDPNTLSGFTYMEGNGPSNAKTFSVSGMNLTADIVLDLGENSNYEISLSENGDYTNSLTLSQTSGTVTSTTIYVRLKADKTAGDYTGTITLTSGTTNVSVTLNGNITAYVAPVTNLPFSFDGGRADIATTAGISQEGLGSDYNSSPKLKFDGTGDYVLLQFNERPGTLTFNIKGNSFSSGSISTFKVQISENGVDYEDLEVYTELGATETKSFNNLGSDVRYIKWIYTEKGATDGGNVALGNISLAQYVVPTGPTVNIGTLTHVTSLEMWYVDTDLVDLNDGDEVVPNTEVFVQPIAESGYSVEGITVVDENDDQVEVTQNSGNWSFIMPNSSVTINATATQDPVPPVTGDKYQLYSGDLVEGDYIIYYDGYSLKNEELGTTGRLSYETVSPNNNVITTDDVTIVWHIAPSGNYWTIYSADADAFAASTGAKNKAQMLADGTDDKALWTVSGNATYEFVNKANLEAVVNANLRNNGTNGFACYSTQTGGALSLYKKVPTLDITGYGTSTGGYYLIASPVSTTPAAAGMITDGLGAQATPETATYDLYSFDQAQELEWINYRQGEFNLEPGKGYLYANKNDVTLTFAGVPSTTSTATLSLSGNGEFAGWNLVGNPFSVPAYIGSRAYYRIGNGGADIVAATAGTAIDVMEGVFVIANENNEVLNFSTTAAKGASVAMNVVRERGNVIDRAIVRFDEGDQLPKFQLNPRNTKIYVTEGNKDYAVVRSAAEADMPVSFKASENGTYSLSIEAENVNMNYLHLIDNMTGADVDLLQTPSYTFEAKTSDYASRFRLVFKASSTSSEADETFAYYNGSSWTVSNLGEATLQVVDVTGRTVSSETINGNATINLNETAGIYMLRLVNGNSVKVQKVVVR